MTDLVPTKCLNRIILTGQQNKGVPCRLALRCLDQENAVFSVYDMNVTQELEDVLFGGGERKPSHPGDGGATLSSK